MAIEAVRIDGRLIHGQVANLWTTQLGITRIMVVDNSVSENDIEKAGLKLACPAGVKFSVLPIEKAAANINAGKYNSQKVFLIARKPEVLLKLIELGVPIKAINVGNMSQTEETRSLSKSINVTDYDVKIFEELNKRGIKLTARMVPSEPESDFMKLLK